MSEREGPVTEARLRLRGLLRQLYAIDDRLRTRHILPGRVSALLEGMDDITPALDGARRRLCDGDPGPPQPEPCLTAADLRDEVLAHEGEARLHYLAECLRAIDRAPDSVQAAALPGATFDVLAFDVRAALRLLLLSHMALVDGLDRAARAHWKGHGPAPDLRLPAAPGACVAVTAAAPPGTGVRVECDGGRMPPDVAE